MKKTSIAAFCTAALASACISSSAFAAPTITTFDNHDFFTALRSADFYLVTENGESKITATFVNKGESDYPNSYNQPSDSDLIYYGDTTITGIRFKCDDGDPLANVTDFSEFSNFSMLNEVVLCDNIDYDFGSGVQVKYNLKPANGTMELTEEAANAFDDQKAEYTFYDNNGSSNVVDEQGGGKVMIGTSSVNVRTIKFNCTDGDPLAAVGDDELTRIFTNMLPNVKTVYVCDNGYEDKLPEGIEVVKQLKRAPKGVMSLTEAAANAFDEQKAKYTFHDDNDNTNVVDPQGDQMVMLAPASENAKTLKFDCTNGDPLAAVGDDELAEIWKMLPNLETVYVCDKGYEDKIPEGIEIINQNAVKEIPAGDYTMDEDDWKKNGNDAKLLDENGKATEYTYGDLQQFLSDIIENPEYDISFKSTNTYEHIVVYYKGKTYLTFEYGTPSEDEEASEAEDIENPNTFDAGIATAVALGSLGLAAGAIAIRKLATRR